MQSGKWEITGYDRPTAVRLYRAGFNSLVSVLLASRGISTAEEYEKLYGVGAATLSNPMTITDMDKAAARIAAAIENDEYVAVYGDYDVDGMTASTIVIDYLRHRGCRCVGYIPERLKDGYGLKPEALERKMCYGITFEQGRNDLQITDEMLANIVTENKTLTDEEKRDLVISLITLKYTQSNSVCFVKDGQAIGVGAGQQSRIHCTRLAGQKADLWHLRQSEKVLNLPLLPTLKRPDRDNTIDLYLSDADCEDVIGDDVWMNYFTEKPERFTAEEKKAYLSTVTGVALGSDAFFPFGDNIERAHKSGVSVIAQPGGSIRDDHVIDTCNKYGIAMAFTGLRLFHH